MFLSDRDIKKGVKNGEIIIKPFKEERLQPASYDISLGNIFVFPVDYEVSFIDPVKKIFPKTREIVIKDGETFVLHPGINVLGYSDEFFGSEHYLIQLGGKSSLARIGLIVHNTAGIINPGHFLNVTFELSNTGHIPVVLHPKMPIGQITFSKLSSPPELAYKRVGRYAGKNDKHFTPPKKRPQKKIK